ncbi:MAG: hypothetical protein ACOYMF_02800 [Bacteroidales bacterium]
MHLLAISLLAILAGTLLLAKIKKEELGKFFTYISWFFLIVGFIVFIGFVAGGICKLSHHCKPGQSDCRPGMNMNDCHPGMRDGDCCSPDMCKSCCEKMEKCMPGDSCMKSCAGHMAGDTTKMVCPKSKETGKP